jgi:hypothetical protein
MRLFKVECAETGSVYSLRLDVDTDQSLIRFKNQLALFVSIPPEDQILLIGPPYKRLDQTFGSQPSGDEPSPPPPPQRIFLYNKRFLVDDSTTTNDALVRLPPHELNIPEPAVDDLAATSTGAYDLVIRLSAASSPLLRALPGYERQLLANLKRGEAFVSFSEQVLTSCRKSLAAQDVQADALQAAIANLKDHFASLKSTFESAQERLAAQQERHRGLLDTFESHLTALADVPLHPALVAAVGGREGLAGLVRSGMGAGMQSSVSNHNYRQQEQQQLNQVQEQQQPLSSSSEDSSAPVTLLGNTPHPCSPRLHHNLSSSICCLFSYTPSTTHNTNHSRLTNYTRPIHPTPLPTPRPQTACPSARSASGCSGAKRCTSPSTIASPPSARCSMTSHGG